jgi:hypothetical protein
MKKIRKEGKKRKGEAELTAGLETPGLNHSDEQTP